MDSKDFMLEIEKAAKTGDRVKLRNFGYFDSSYAALLKYEE